MITSEDVVLIDTNMLVYAADQTSPLHDESRAFRDRGRKGEFVPFAARKSRSGSTMSSLIRGASASRSAHPRRRESSRDISVTPES